MFFFCELFFKGLSLIILKLISFFIARYLTVSLRGPVLTLRQGRQAEFPTTRFFSPRGGHSLPSGVSLQGLLESLILLYHLRNVL